MLSIQIVLEGIGKVRRVEPRIEKEIIALLPRLRRFALALTRSVPAADDLAQATVERAIVNLDKWQPGTRLDSWMYRIAHNLHRNEVRNQATRGEKLGIIQTGAERAVDGERAAMARLEFSAVSAAIARLPGEQREALLLVAVEGRSYREVAEITGDTTDSIAKVVEAFRRPDRSFLMPPVSVMLEGETILGYRLVHLKSGVNRVQLPVDHSHFPNFNVADACISIGAITYSRVAAAWSISLSTIWSTVCVPIGTSQSGQCGVPSRAIRIRR